MTCVDASHSTEATFLEDACCNKNGLQCTGIAFNADINLKPCLNSYRNDGNYNFIDILLM